METIKIAPDLDEIFVEGNTVKTDFAGGHHLPSGGVATLQRGLLKTSFSVRYRFCK